MARTAGIGIQDFGKLMQRNCFYADKTSFIKEWWENGDDVTLIARPRRFGKTLMMSTLDYFFSTEHKSDGNLFERLSIWEEEKYRELQGNYPVIYLSFASLKANNFEETKRRICHLITQLYQSKRYL